MNKITKIILKNLWPMYLGGALSVYGHPYYSLDFWVFVIPIAILAGIADLIKRGEQDGTL
jgi:hypothetical protein